MMRSIASRTAGTIPCAFVIEGAPGRAVGGDLAGDSALVAGSSLGERYRIVRELGRGGMGVVYLARDRRLDMDVAIKLVAIAHGEATLWLKREFRAVSSLRHANLVELYELGTHGTSCYFTMEYLAGADPRHWIALADPAREAHSSRAGDAPTATVPPMQEAQTADFADAAPDVADPSTRADRPVPTVDFERVRGVIAGLAEALAFLHGRGVIHRDVKPSNVLVVDGVAKLLDFGLALEQHRQDGELAPEGRIVGTAAYLAPEYLDRLQVSPALDVYALGVLAFELVTGAPPFGGALHVLARKHRELAVPRVQSRVPLLPPDFGALMDRMLSASPAGRPTALEVAEAITGSQSQPAAHGRRLGFIGRAEPLLRVTERLGDPTPRGRLVLVTGASGVGKTALVDEAVGRAAMAGTTVWRGRCDERERVPYRAFDQIIDDLAGELFIAPDIARRLEHAGALARVFPVLWLALESLRVDGDREGASLLGEPAGDLRVERERAMLALVELVRHLVRGSRAALVIDDLQWADDESLELLALLVEKIDRPVTVVASFTMHRAEELTVRARALIDRLAAHGQVEVVALAAMAEDELLALMSELAPRVATARLVAAAHLAAGSPYLAELIGRELATADVADPRDAETRRLARLRPDERKLAEIVATAGEAATFDPLRAVAELSSVRVRSALRGLEEARVVRATPTAAGDSAYAFYHQRLRVATAAGLPAAESRALHEKFARWYETAVAARTSHAAQLAFHWEEAGAPTRAAQWALAAGDAARARLAWSVAADWYTRALGLGALDPDGVRAARADARFLGGKLADAADDYLVLADRAATPPIADRHRVRAAEAFLKLGEIPRGMAVMGEVLARRGVSRAAGRVGSLTRAAVVAATWLAPGPARRQPVDPVLADAYRAIASFLSTPHPIEALEYVLRGIALAERSADRAAHSQGMAMLAAYLAAGTLGKLGDRALAKAERLAIESGAPYAEMVAAGCAGILAMLRGDWQGMREAHGIGERVCRRLGIERSWEASFLRSYAALGEYYAGDPLRSLTMLEELSGTADDLFGRAMIATYRGRALVLAGDLDAARVIARSQAADRTHDQGMAGVYRRLFEAELALADHDWIRAKRLARELGVVARREWLSVLPAVSAMSVVVAGTAELGIAVGGDRAAATRATMIAKRLRRIGGASFYAVTALRIEAQAHALRGEVPCSARDLARAAEAARTRGGAVERMAVAALRGERIDPGPLGPAIVWSTGGAVTL